MRERSLVLVASVAAPAASPAGVPTEGLRDVRYCEVINDDLYDTYQRR
jgi:hypothetical protein